MTEALERRLREAYRKRAIWLCESGIREYESNLLCNPHAKKDYRSSWKSRLEMYQEELAAVQSGQFTYLLIWSEFVDEELLGYGPMYGEEGLAESKERWAKQQAAQDVRYEAEMARRRVQQGGAG